MVGVLMLWSTSAFWLSGNVSSLSLLLVDSFLSILILVFPSHTHTHTPHCLITVLIEHHYSGSSSSVCPPPLCRPLLLLLLCCVLLKRLQNGGCCRGFIIVSKAASLLAIHFSLAFLFWTKDPLLLCALFGGCRSFFYDLDDGLPFGAGQTLRTAV